MQYYLLVGKEKSGPFEIAELIAAPGFSPESLVVPRNNPIKRRNSWKSARRFKDIAAALKSKEKDLNLKEDKPAPKKAQEDSQKSDVGDAAESVEAPADVEEPAPNRGSLQDRFEAGFLTVLGAVVLGVLALEIFTTLRERAASGRPGYIHPGGKAPAAAISFPSQSRP